MSSRLFAHPFHRFARMASLASLAAFVAAPALAQDAEEASPEPAVEEQPAEGEAPAEPAESPSEPESGGAFSYHGMVIEKGEVVEEPSPDMLEEFFGVVRAAGEEVETRAPASIAATAYAQQCKKEGVPIPPSFKGNDWKRIGRLPKGRVFASSDKPRAEVMVYKPMAGGKPTGVCVALPRGPEDGSVELMGVICQSKKSGKACFWDNWDRTASAPTQMKGASYKDMDIDRFQDGSMLKENCTNCHRGDNVYVIHADTLLAKSPLDSAARSPDVRYTPIGQAAWVNPEHANPPSNCTDCHGLPAFSSNYCSAVLMNSLGETMPPDRPTDWKKTYKSDIEQICRECGSTTGVCATP
jgi:hypothetical protein